MMGECGLVFDYGVADLAAVVESWVYALSGDSAPEG